MDMKLFDKVAFWLVVIGAVNWGLAAFDFNLVNMLVGSWPVVEKAVYVLVAISGVYLAFQSVTKKD